MENYGNVSSKKSILVRDYDYNYSLLPLKYDWAWTSYKSMLNNLWTPEEKGAADDIRQWRMGELSDQEQHMYLTVFAQLTTFDLMRTADLVQNLIPYISAPEIIQVLTFQAAQEAIHNHAYTYLIESLGLPQDDIYTRYKRVKELRDRCEFTQEVSKLPDIELIRIGDPDAIRQLLKALIFYYCIFEGVWFYLNLLGPVQSLARRRLMLGTATQFQYIARDEQQHVMVGEHLIKGIIKEYPDVTISQDFKNEIEAMVKDALQLEDAFIDCALPSQILGYNTFDHKKTARHYAERWLKRVGFEMSLEGEHKLLWIDEQMSLRKEKNFFETRVTEYKVGADLWGEEDTPNPEHPDWDDPLKISQ